RDLALSSVGIGSYLGPLDDATDDGYTASVTRALALGINVVDTAINYRAQRSEHAVGRAIAVSALLRDEVIVASKAGFLPFDRARPADPAAYFRATYLDTGLIPPGELACGCHSLAPRFLADQLTRSRTNTGLATLDIYYLHNPETQLDEIDRPTFLARMRAAFTALEAAVSDGAIRFYGTATWSGYRVPPTARDHLDLAELVGLARDVAGDAHHFAFVQLPLNPAMPEAATLPTQRGRTLLQAAAELGLHVMSSSSIHQGRLPATLAETRTTPGLGTALVGMSRPAHVDANAASFRR
ncbi:MAG TPA: aldo/keto reductase, partial [Kofleriaceae bacterium]|nr:aldo/keto reductase [Kofleriaceae bacterium]